MDMKDIPTLEKMLSELKEEHIDTDDDLTAVGIAAACFHSAFLQHCPWNLLPAVYLPAGLQV